VSSIGSLLSVVGPSLDPVTEGAPDSSPWVPDGCPHDDVEVVRMLGAAVQVMATELGDEEDEDAEED